MHITDHLMNLEVYEHNFELLDLFLKCGGDINIEIGHHTILTSISGRPEVAIEILKRYKDKIDINKKNDYGSTPLICALNYNNNNDYSYIRKLIKYGADVNLAHHESGMTPLIAAVKNASVNAFQGAIRHLLKAGANPNISDNEGNSPLMLLGQTTSTALAPEVFWSEPENKEMLKQIARELIRYGANIYHKNKAGKSVLEHFESHPYLTEVGNIIKDHMQMQSNAVNDRFKKFLLPIAKSSKTSQGPQAISPVERFATNDLFDRKVLGFIRSFLATPPNLGEARQSSALPSNDMDED